MDDDKFANIWNESVNISIEKPVVGVVYAKSIPYEYNFPENKYVDGFGFIKFTKRDKLCCVELDLISVFKVKTLSK